MRPVRKMCRKFYKQTLYVIYEQSLEMIFEEFKFKKIHLVRNEMPTNHKNLTIGNSTSHSFPLRTFPYHLDFFVNL